MRRHPVSVKDLIQAPHFLSIPRFGRFGGGSLEPRMASDRIWVGGGLGGAETLELRLAAPPGSPRSARDWRPTESK